MVNSTRSDEVSGGARRKLDRCPFCHGPIFEKYSGIGDRLQTTTETFAIDECVDCGGAILSPAPVGDVSGLYPANYLSAQAGTAKARRFDLERWYRYNQYEYDFKLLQRATGVGIAELASYLDLGCGSGERVTYASERGCPRAVGVDKFDFAKSRARHEANIINTEILSYMPSDRFEAVSLFHVLEHLDEPARVLTHVRQEILQPGGHVIVQVPNYASLERRWFGKRWFGLDVPRHYWQFNPRAISRLLNGAGYQVDAIYQQNAPLHPVSIVSSMFPEVDVQRIWVKPGKGTGYRQAMTLLWAGLTLLTVPLCVIENLLDRASMLTVVASGS
jgi:SAM-dependent methyltransferase